MKILQIVSLILLVLGILFKFIYFPGGNLFTLLGGLSLLVYSLIYMIKNFSLSRINSFLNFSLSLITLYLISRINYWSIAKPIFFISLISSLITFGMILGYKINLRIRHILFVVYFLLFIAISFVHSDKIYYVFNYKILRTTEVSHIKNPCLSYEVFNKYSWFLYLADKYDKALEYNELAEKIAIKCAQDQDYVNKDIVEKHLQSIRQNNNLIKEKKWRDFEELFW